MLECLCYSVECYGAECLTAWLYGAVRGYSVLSHTPKKRLCGRWPCSSGGLWLAVTAATNESTVTRTLTTTNLTSKGVSSQKGLGIVINYWNSLLASSKHALAHQITEYTSFFDPSHRKDAFQQSPLQKQTRTHARDIIRRHTFF